METTPKALKQLYVAMGGELDDTYEGIASGAKVGNYTATPDVIEAISKAVASAASALMKPLVVTIIPDDDDPTRGTTDVDIQEIHVAIDEGRRVQIHAYRGTDLIIADILTFSTGENGDSFAMIGISEPSGVLTEVFMPYSQGYDKTVILKQYQLTEYNG